MFQLRYGCRKNKNSKIKTTAVKKLNGPATCHKFLCHIQSGSPDHDFRMNIYNRKNILSVSYTLEQKLPLLFSSTRERKPHPGEKQKKGEKKRFKQCECLNRKKIPGAVLLSHSQIYSTIAAGALNYRVREGNVCFCSAMDAGK